MSNPLKKPSFFKKIIFFKAQKNWRSGLKFSAQKPAQPSFFNQLFVRQNRRKVPFSTRLLSALKIVPFVAILVFVIWSIPKTDPTEFLDITVNWTIDAGLPIEQSALLARIDPLIQNKYQLDLHQIKLELEQMPWVKSARVRRSFWNAIEIKIVAQKIALRWQNVHCQTPDNPLCSVNDAENSGYISPQGVLFTPHLSVQSDAPQVRSSNAPEVVVKLLADYAQYQKILKPARITLLTRTNANIDKLNIAPNIALILGYQLQIERLLHVKKIMHKFRKKIKRLQRKKRKITFDMRYPKGFVMNY